MSDSQEKLPFGNQHVLRSSLAPVDVTPGGIITLLEIKITVHNNNHKHFNNYHWARSYLLKPTRHSNVNILDMTVR